MKKETKGNLTISNKILEKYFGYLIHLDNRAKKRLIAKLTESLSTKKSSQSDLKNLFGAWEDERDSDEIIAEIKETNTSLSKIL